MKFSYRTSILQKQPGICIAAIFQLKKGYSKSIVSDMKNFKNYRRKTQPFDRCCGSVFRNPLPDHAGYLIESAGLKGYQIGNARVSELHGNFIINVKDAKAADVHKLIDHVKKTIYEKYEVTMHTEVEIIKR